MSVTRGRYVLAGAGLVAVDFVLGAVFIGLASVPTAVRLFAQPDGSLFVG